MYGKGWPVPAGNPPSDGQQPRGQESRKSCQTLEMGSLPYNLERSLSPWVKAVRMAIPAETHAVSRAFRSPLDLLKNPVAFVTLGIRIHERLRLEAVARLRDDKSWTADTNFNAAVAPTFNDIDRRIAQAVGLTELARYAFVK